MGLIFSGIIEALARRERANRGDVRAIETVRTRLRTDWPRYAVVEIKKSLV